MKSQEKIKKSLYNVNMEIFGIRIKRELKELGKTQTSLAQYLNVQKSTVSEWLNNNNEPPMICIVEIAKFLNVTTDYLLGLEDEAGTKTYNNYGVHNGDVTFK